MGGKHSRTKGANYERELVKELKEAGIYAERRVRNYSGEHDIDIFPSGPDEAALIAEAKIRAKLPAWLMRWLGENDLLFMRQDRGETIAVLPWRTLEALLRKARP
jgi:Holliday junction resolvase